MFDVEIVGEDNASYMGIGETVEDTQLITAIEVLTTGGTNDEASRLSGIAIRTLYRVKKTQRWKELQQEIHADMLGNARAAIIGMVAKARKAVEEVIDAPDLKGAPTKLSAALAVLDRATHIIPDGGDNGIRRIITRVPRSLHTPEIPQETAGEPMPQPESPTALDSPTNWGIAGDTSHPRALRTGRFRQAGMVDSSAE